MMGQFIDLTGRRFGMLTVLRRVQDRIRGWPRWLCLCDCGNEKEVASGALRNGDSVSCGCYGRQQMANRLAAGMHKTHGRSKSSVYQTWLNIRLRCHDKKNKAYPAYGGRGIRVCERWLSSFENFLADMGEKPGTDYSIDRRDNDGDYEPLNCRWATRREQCGNRRDNRYFELNGENLIMSEWARRLGTSTDTIDMRLKSGWPLEKALTQKVRGRA